MKKLLYIRVNPKEESKSKGAEIGDSFLQTFQEEQPHVEIDKINLYELNIPEIDQDLLYARAKLSFMGYKMEDLSESEKDKYNRMMTLREHFLSADYYVFVTPMWNLGAPPILKSYMDNMFAFGTTFTREDGESKGLLTDKKAVHIQTRGGLYTEGPMREFEMGDQYIRKALQFLGVNMMDTVIAEGLDHFPKQVPEIMEKAKEQAKRIAYEIAK